MRCSLTGAYRGGILPSQRAIKARLKSGNYDLVIDLQNSSHSRRFQSWLQDAFISSTSKYANIKYYRDASRSLASREYLREQVETIGVDMSAGYFSDLTWAAEDVEQILTQNEIQNGLLYWWRARLLAIPKSDGKVFLH